MRRFLWIGIIVLIIVAVFYTSSGDPASSKDPYLTLNQLMELAGAKVTGGELYYWATLAGTEDGASSPELELRAEEIWGRIQAGDSGPVEDLRGEETVATGESFPECSFFSPTSSPVSSTPGSAPGNEEGSSAFSVNLVEKEGVLFGEVGARMLLQELEGERGSTSHLLVTFNQPGSPDRLPVLARRLPALLQPEISENTTSFSLAGYREGPMTPGEMEELAASLIREIGGEVVGTIRDGNMVSVTGYTSGLKDYLQAEELRINLNLALRYDERTGQTTIRAGTPLIQSWY